MSGLARLCWALLALFLRAVASGGHGLSKVAAPLAAACERRAAPPVATRNSEEARP